MKKFRTLIIFFILVAVWGAIFSSLKFFVWGDFQNTIIKPDLQIIAGYLSLGGVFAYLIGGAFAVTFVKRYYLLIISFLSLFFLSFLYFANVNSTFVFAFIISMIGFLYGLWNIVKNVIIAIEIEKTGLAETIVNALAGIIFVVFIVVGSLLGNILFETIGHSGYIVIFVMLFLTAGLGFSLDYEKINFESLINKGIKFYLHNRTHNLKKSLKLFIPDLKYIIKNYTGIILGSALLWTISTIVSQVSVEYSVDTFGVEASKATFVLLYSALGAIIGNVLSMKMNNKRWFFYIIFNSLFAILIFLFPFIAVTFTYLSIAALVLGLFFGVSSNLVDSYLLKRIGEEDKKEYGSSTYGFVLSILIFVMMMLSSYIVKQFSFTILMIGLGIIMLIIGFYLYFNQRKS